MVLDNGLHPEDRKQKAPFFSSFFLCLFPFPERQKRRRFMPRVAEEN